MILANLFLVNFIFESTVIGLKIVNFKEIECDFPEEFVASNFSCSIKNIDRKSSLNVEIYFNVG